MRLIDANNGRQRTNVNAVLNNLVNDLGCRPSRAVSEVFAIAFYFFSVRRSIRGACCVYVSRVVRKIMKSKNALHKMCERMVAERQSSSDCTYTRHYVLEVSGQITYVEFVMMRWRRRRNMRRKPGLSESKVGDAQTVAIGEKASCANGQWIRELDNCISKIADQMVKHTAWNGRIEGMGGVPRDAGSWSRWYSLARSGVTCVAAGVGSG